MDPYALDVAQPDPEGAPAARATELGGPPSWAWSGGAGPGPRPPETARDA